MIHLFRNTGKVRPFIDLPLLVLIFLCSTWVISGQENPGPQVLRLSPQDAVDLAIRHNLVLENARIDLDTRRRREQLIWNQFLPSVDVAGTLLRHNWPNTVTVGPGMTMNLPQWNVNGTLSASFIFSFALLAGIEVIRLDYQAGLVSLERARLQIERDVRKMYNQILLLQENAVLLRDSFANAERQAAMAEANFRAGLVPRLSWLQAQVAVENMKPTLSEMDNNLRALKASFAMNLGLPFGTVIELEPFTPEAFHIPLDLAELIAQASTGRPDIVELQSNIAVLHSTRRAQALQIRTPFLRLGWTLTSTFNPMLDPFRDNLLSGDNWNRGGNFSVTLGMNINSILPFTREGQGLKDLDNRVRSLNITLAQAIRGTELEIFTKVNSLMRIQTSAEVQKAAVELAELSYNLTEEAYRAGLQDFQSVQNALLALQQARLQLLTQNFNYLNDLLDLEYAVGIPFGTLSTF